jgi:adenylyltransferase/sulfurtransferase
MNDEQLLRYSRQIMLPQFDIAGQERLLDAHVVIVGLGGLGSPAAMYLAAAGVGHLTLIDYDNVDLTNLQRQILHTSADIGKSKTSSALETLKNINPEIKLSAINTKLENDKLKDLIEQASVVIDATDNFDSRFLLNELCVRACTPLVSGAAIRMEGQVCVFLNHKQRGPCYRCLYRNEGDNEESCSETGVLAPVVGIIGSIQAVEALKIIANMGQTLNNRVLLLDAMTMEWRTLKLNKDPACPVCQA